MMVDTSWSGSIKPIDIVRFFQLLPDRAPQGSGDSDDARDRVALAAARLNATMLGRELDPRVPRDIDTLSEQLAARSQRYGSDDWSRPVGETTLLSYAQQVVAEISFDLRGTEPDEDADEWGDHEADN